MVLGGRSLENDDRITFFIEHLWKLIVLGGQRMENDDYIAFVVENVSKQIVLGGRIVENDDDCIAFLIENLWKP